MITGRENNRQYYDAMPPPGPAPRLIAILQGYHGHDDIGAHQEAAAALTQRLGASGLSVAGDSSAMQQIAQASGVRYIGGRLTPPCNHTKCKNDHSFPAATEDEVDGVMSDWANNWVDMMKGIGTNMSALNQLEMCKHTSKTYDAAPARHA